PVISDEQLVKQQVRIKQAELKLAEAEKKLADFSAQTSNAEPGATSAPVTVAAAAVAPAVDMNDPVAAAIARAQAKLTMSPEDKARANLESLRARLAKAEEKVAAAKTEGSANLDALQQGAEKLQQKITEALGELTALGIKDEPIAVPEPVAPVAPVAEPVSAEQSAAQAAIEKAKAKAAAMASMSDEEKRAEQIQSLQTRLQKARERLAKAEAENDANIEAFRAGVTKLEEKLNELA
ncbi:MAG: electron transport complex subunit RsxC, partial [Cellvibrio sp.]